MLALAVALLAVNIVFSVCFYSSAKKRFSRDRLLRDVEKELDLLYKALQREIDNSLSVIEDRTASLNSLIEAADKRILLAASEIEKRERAESFAVKPAEHLSPEPTPDAEEAEPASDEGAKEEDAPSKVAVYSKRQIIAKALETKANRPSPASTAPTSAKPVAPEIPSRERVVMLARQDISPDEIAKILSIPQSEVDLILALDL